MHEHMSWQAKEIWFLYCNHDGLLHVKGLNSIDFCLQMVAEYRCSIKYVKVTLANDHVEIH